MLNSAQLGSRTAQTYRTSAFGSKGATRNTTTAPTRHALPGRRQNTTHVPHDTPTHRPRNAPTNQPTHHATALQCSANVCVVSYSNLAREQAGYTAKRTKYCCCTKDSNSGFISHRHESTQPRTKRPPSTHPTNRPPTDQPILPPNIPTNMCYRRTAVQQQYSSTAVVQQYSSSTAVQHVQLVRTPANRDGWSALDFLSCKHNHGCVAPPAEFKNVLTTHSHPSTDPQPTHEPVPVPTAAW